MHNDGDSVKHTAVARARRIRSAKKNRATLVAAACSVPEEEEPEQANGPPPSEDGDPDVGGGSEEGWGQEDVAVLTYSVGPSYAEVVVAGVRTTVQLEGASPERQQLVQLFQKSYDQLLREAKARFGPGFRQKVTAAVNRAHYLASQAYQRLIDCYHRVLYRDIDPVGEIRIPKKAVLRRPEIADLEIKPIQERVPGAEVCAGLVSTWSLAGMDSGLVEPRLAADSDPAAREEYSRRFPRATVRTDCRGVSAKDYTDLDIQLVQASVPCGSWTHGGSQRGVLDEEGNLMVEMFPHWRDRHVPGGRAISST